MKFDASTIDQGWSNAVVYVGALLAIFAISLQLFSFTYPPLIDLPNHLARHAIQCGNHQAAGLGAYYEFNLKLVPNLTADLIYTFDWACRDVLLTNRILIQVAMLNLVAAVYVLHFALWRRLSVWPAAACLLVYNMSFSYGFENYVLAAPFALYFFAAWIWLSERGALVRLGLMVPLASGIYVLHMIVFGFAMVLVTGWEIQRIQHLFAARSITKREGIARLIGIALLALPATAHFTYLQFFRYLAQNGPGTIFGTLEYRLDALLSPIIPLPWGHLDGPQQDSHVATIAFLVVVILLGRVFGVLRFDSRMRWTIALGIAVVMAAPLTFSGVSFTHVRYPYLLAGVLIASIHWVVRPRTQAVLALCFLAVFLVRTDQTKHIWAKHEREVRELLAATEALPADARILPAYSRYDVRFLMHLHSISYVGVQSGAFIPALFTGAIPLEPRPAYRNFFSNHGYPPELPSLLAEREAYTLGATTDQARGRYWSGWPENFTHVLVFGPREGEVDALEESSVEIHTGSFFTLYRLEAGRSSR